MEIFLHCVTSCILTLQGEAVGGGGQGSGLLGRGVERVSSNGECPSEVLLLSMGASTRKCIF